MGGVLFPLPGCTFFDTWILCHDRNDGLVHLSVIVLGEALVGADVGWSESVDLKLDDAVAGVGASELLTDLDVLAFTLERNLKGEIILFS